MSFTEIRGILYDILASVSNNELREPKGSFIAKLDAYQYPDPVADLRSYIGRQPESKLLKEEAEALLKLTKVAETNSNLDLGSKEYEAKGKPKRRRRNGTR
jgi:hypothetical protein